MNKNIIRYIFILCICTIHVTAQNKYLDFERDLNKTGEQLEVSNSYDISYVKCIAYYELCLKSDYYESDFNVLKKKNIKIYKEIQRINTACILFQINENRIKNEQYFDLFSNISLNNFPFRERPYLVECDIMIITFYKDDKSFKCGFITSIEKIGT